MGSPSKFPAAGARSWGGFAASSGPAGSHAPLAALRPVEVPRSHNGTSRSGSDVGLACCMIASRFRPDKHSAYMQRSARAINCL